MKKRSVFQSSAIIVILFLIIQVNTTLAGALYNTQHQPSAIILFIGDGMGAAQRRAGRWAAAGIDGQLVMNTLPTFGWAITNNAAGGVTDSAAAATAMSTGEKTFNGRLGIDIDMRALPTILEQAQEQGWSTGLVSTVQLAHATPAAFASHEISRYSYDAISLQILEHRVNVLLAGGEDDFLPETENGCYSKPGTRGDDRNLITEAVDEGYTYICDESQLAAIDRKNTTHLLGLFANKGMQRPYEPSLEQMTRIAIEILSHDPDGFFLMVEGGQIDWAASEQDAQNVIADVLGLDAAVNASLTYARANPNTLIIVTGDHETGGMSVDLEPGGKPTEDGPFQMPDGTPFYVNWTTTAHTSVNVPVTAYGPNAEFLIGTYENTHIYEVMHRLLAWEVYLPNVQNSAETRETLKYQVKSDKISKPQ